MSKITNEMRRKALLQDYKNKGKSDRSWYLIGSDELEEKYQLKSFTPDEGHIFLSIIERWESEKFFLELFVHYNIGSDNHAFLCVDKMFGEPCPICALRNELKTAGEPEDIYNLYRYTKRYLMWVVNAETARTIKEGTHLYDAPTTVKNGILDICVDPRNDKIIDPSDQAEMVNVVFKRVGKKGYQNTKYTGFKLEDREEELSDEFFDVPPMEDLLIKPDIAEMKKCVGLPVRDTQYDDEEEAEETTRPKRTKGVSKFRRHKIDKEEEQEETKRKTKRFRNRKEEETSDDPIGEIFDPEKIDDEENGDDDFPFDEEEEKKKILDRTRKRINRSRRGE